MSSRSPCWTRWIPRCTSSAIARSVSSKLLGLSSSSMEAMIAAQPRGEIKVCRQGKREARLNRTHTFELGESTVTVKAPEGAEFADLEGLPEGQRHLTWTAGPGAFFMVSASDGFEVPDTLDSDEPAPLAGP